MRARLFLCKIELFQAIDILAAKKEVYVMPPGTRNEIQKHKEKMFSGVRFTHYESEEYQKMGTAELALKEAHRQQQLGRDKQAAFKSGVAISEERLKLTARLRLTDRQQALFARRYTDAEAHLPKLEGMGKVLEKRLPKRHIYEPKDTFPPQMSHFDKKKARSVKEDTEKKDYETKKKTAHLRFVSEGELETDHIQKKVLAKVTEVPRSAKKSEKITQKALMLRVMEGDYSNLQQLDPLLRSVAAKNYMEQLRIDNLQGNSADDIVNALFKAGGVPQMMNPLFRIGVSILMNGGKLESGFLKNVDAKTWRQVEDLCNQRIMSATIYTGPQLDPNGADKEQVLANADSQIFIAKTLLACHLGRLQRKDTEQNSDGRKVKVKRDWEGGVATAFAHCSRVAFVLPGNTATMEKMTGGDGGLKAGFKVRSAATHKIAKKKKGDKNSSLVEKKSIGHFFGQRGMNVAIGGLGNDGVAGYEGKMRQLKNDGSCGHIYMHVDKGDEKTYTGLLVGFESDAPGVVNMTGHKHGLGNPEFASSFGGMRTDEIGDKYGGRVVDLSATKPKVFEKAMDMLSVKMSHLMSVAWGGGEDAGTAQEELMFISDMLSGNLMSMQDIERVVGGKIDV